MYFSQRLGFFFVIFQIVLFGLGAMIVYHTTSDKLRQAFVERADTLSAGIAESVQSALCSKPISEMNALLEKINRSSHGEYVAIRDGESIIASAGILPARSNPELLAQLKSNELRNTYASFSEIPHCTAGHSPYELEVGNSFQNLDQPLQSLLWIQSAVVLAEFILFLGFSFFLSKLLARRLEKIFDACKQISSGNFDLKLPKSGKDEFSKIFLEIHRTSQSLKELVLERDRQRSKLTASAKMSSLGEMAGGIAHEINNPLAIISGKAAIIKRLIQRGDINQEKLTEDLLKIEQTTARIAKIIKGLRTFSRNADHDPMSMTPVVTIIADTLELCKERFKNHSIDLRVKCDSDAQIECRPAQIAQVLVNLLGNAYDAVENLEEKWVSLTLEAGSSSVKISVGDSGSGISPAIAEKIMDPFFTTKDVGKGTGLGLSISKGIAENHHGHLTVDASAKNTVFVLELPYQQNATQS